MKSVQQIISENRPWVVETFSKVESKLSLISERSRNICAPDGLDENGRHYNRDPRGWTSGFFGGLNAMLYEYTKKEGYLLTAKRQEELLDEALMDFAELHHDVGFMWHLLSGALYNITGDEKSKNRNLHAAASLFSRFVPSGGFIRAWNGPWDERNVGNWTIIDCLMNLPILYWASDVLGDDRFKQIAQAHADMALVDHLRADGSVVHIVEHDRETGEVLKTYGGQGIAEGSSWSRGQAWALYGFVISYKHTGDERYLDAAKQVAHYFISCVSDDWLPRVDFRAPAEPVYYDSTAGAIAACGLIEIAKIESERDGGMYVNAAISILRAMEEKFMDYNPDTDGLLMNGTIRYPVSGSLADNGVHVSIVYGDYFYTEALLKLLGSEFFTW